MIKTNLQSIEEGKLLSTLSNINMRFQVYEDKKENVSLSHITED